MNFDIINPANGQKVKTYPGMSDADVLRVIEQAAKAQMAWKRVDFDERARLMRAAGQVLQRRAAEFARQMAEEMGKPLKQGVDEVEKCASVCDYYADNAADLLAPRPFKTEARKSFACFQPLGVVLTS